MTQLYDGPGVVDGFDPERSSPEHRALELPDDEESRYDAQADAERLFGASDDHGPSSFEETRLAPRPMRVVGAAALAAGTFAVLALVAFRALAGRRRKPRTVRSAVARSLTAELATRVALGAAGVIGARVASELIMPAIEARLALEADDANRPRAKRRGPPRVPGPNPFDE